VLVKVSRTLIKVSRMLSEAGLTLLKVSRMLSEVSPMLSELGLTLSEVGRTLIKVSPMLSEPGRTLIKVSPMPFELGPTLSKVGPMPSDTGGMLINLRGNSSERRPTFSTPGLMLPENGGRCSERNRIKKNRARYPSISHRFEMETSLFQRDRTNNLPIAGEM